MSYRFLLVALCLCSLAAFAQDHSLLSGNADRNTQQVPDFRTQPASTQSEPWRILPKAGSDKDKNLILMTPELGPEGIALTPGGPLAAETMCYSIRSYVVARDHKHSDSVHPVGYTTCVPASRYRLKTADVQIVR